MNTLLGNEANPPIAKDPGANFPFLRIFPESLATSPAIPMAHPL
jgi:hypothetical protein